MYYIQYGWTQHFLIHVLIKQQWVIRGSVLYTSHRVYSEVLGSLIPHPPLMEQSLLGPRNFIWSPAFLCNYFPHLAHCSTLKKEAAISSEILIPSYQTTQPHIAQSLTLTTVRTANLKLLSVFKGWNQISYLQILVSNDL